MDNLQKLLATLSENVDNFPIGAANVHDTVSKESEINTLQSTLHCIDAEILRLQVLTEIAKNSNANKGKSDDTPISSYENTLGDKVSAINHPQNMVLLADEATALQEALEMQPEEMEYQPSSYRSILESIKKIVLKCSSTQLELLNVQNDINERLKDIQQIEVTLMKKKSKFANELAKQQKQLIEKRSSEDEGYERMRKEIKRTATKINKLKMVTQGLIHLSPEALVKNERLLDILRFTRKPLNLATYSTQL